MRYHYLEIYYGKDKPMLKKSTIAAVFLMLVSAAVLCSQDWITTFGTVSPYQLPEYLSGYGVSDLPNRMERLETARNAALSQLSRQVSTRIVSSDDFIETDDDRGYSSRYTSRIQTSTDLKIGGASFETVEIRGTTHVLAWVEISSLRQQFLQEVMNSRSALDTAMVTFDQSLERGALERAEEELLKAQKSLTVIYDSLEVIRALDILSGKCPESILNPYSYEQLLQDRQARAASFMPADALQAAEHLARQLYSQVGFSAQVMPLIYGDTDFSSAFGSRMAGMIESQLMGRSGGSSSNAYVVRGNYWIHDASVEIHLNARNMQSGAAAASVRTSIPISSVEESTLRPVNADRAFEDGMALLGEQVVSGGLDVEVWTDRGRNERTLAFEEGDIIQFYFRVNQPAFLQLSYVLATGETVLLEESFYIGSDRVNRIVSLPYQFQVVPPFGVERLIVTAHSQSPPKADVIPRRISGQWYEVFRTVGDAVAQTRGLARVRTEETQQVRVGEASLVITTMAAEK